MAFKNADAFGYSIALPVRGRIYVIESPPVDIGHSIVSTTVMAGRLNDLGSALQSLAPDDPDRPKLESQIRELAEGLEVPDNLQGDYLRSVLGAAYDEMIENKEPFELVKLAASTVSVWVINGREAAEDFWNSGGRPPRPRKALGDRRRKKTGTSK